MPVLEQGKEGYSAECGSKHSPAQNINESDSVSSGHVSDTCPSGLLCVYVGRYLMGSL